MNCLSSRATSTERAEQGGNIVIWSSNGDIDAGKGAKTSVSAPPPLFSCDIDWACSADIKGVVSGAGIATLQSIARAPVGNANLMAPRGKVDAGAAGIRTSGNLNIAALLVVNAFNIQSQGTITGLPTYTGPSIGTLTTASNVAGAVQVAVPAAKNDNKNQPSMIIVEVIGYGGGSDDENQQPQDQRRDNSKRSDAAPIYNPNGPVRILGVGSLTDDEKQSLSEAEKGRL